MLSVRKENSPAEREAQGRNGWLMNSLRRSQQRLGSFYDGYLHEWFLATTVQLHRDFLFPKSYPFELRFLQHR